MHNNEEPRVIIGIDPGTRITGYGIIIADQKGCRLLDYGCIKPPIQSDSAQRYLVIFDAIDHLLERYQPQALAVETQFFYKNAQSALKLGMARGVTIVAAARRKVPVHEYAPTRAKQSVTGNGRASKQQVQSMVKILLNLSSLPTPEDAADALSLALCHAHTIR